MSVNEQQVRDFARSCVRSGLLDERQLLEELSAVIAADLPHRAAEAPALAAAWIESYRAELDADQRHWPEVTDHDRLQAVFAILEESGVVVLQGCEDHWSAKAVLDDRAATGHPALGVAWFTAPDVWHAIDAGMLEVNLWHGTTANVAPGDALLAQVLAVFAEHGLKAHFDEGRIEVGTHWQRRPSPPRSTMKP